MLSKGPIFRVYDLRDIGAITMDPVISEPALLGLLAGTFLGRWLKSLRQVGCSVGVGNRDLVAPSKCGPLRSLELFLPSTKETFVIWYVPITSSGH